MPCGKGWADLRVVRGFDAARAVLSRQAAGVHFDTSPAVKKRLSDVFGRELTVEQAVSLIVEDVRQRRDVALFDYCRRFEGVELSALEVTEEEFQTARKEAPVKLMMALHHAARRIHEFHRAQKGVTGTRLNAHGIGVMVRP